LYGIRKEWHWLRCQFPPIAEAEASVELAWTQGATLGRRLDIRLTVLDADGAAHVVERMLAL